ncbi:MAG: PQQ-binding-like beta-propeller repeat protein [Vicinamibacterales bacterium]
MTRIALCLLGLVGVLLPGVGQTGVMATTAATAGSAAQAAALQPASEWPTLAANPQRTSHNDVEVRGDLRVDWYRVIDPYVDAKVQVIAAAGRVFLSTSQGLYAFDAATGTELWVYGTELPLGHSPTVATIGGRSIVYAPGFDHRVHAIDAATGAPVEGYTPFEAGAGFETNPLVLTGAGAGSPGEAGNPNLIIAASRDGQVYGLDAVTGAKRWSVQTGGPIRFSPAYDAGRAYVASDDGFAYAIDARTGTVVWKSAALPGAGFSTYWPVIWTDTHRASPTSGQTFILLTLSKKAATYGWWGPGTAYHQENDEMEGCAPAGAPPPYLWSGATAVLDCSPIFDYFNQRRPDRRNLIALRATDGTEVTPYAPVNWAGASHGGQKHPPIVGGDGVLYTEIGYNHGGNGGCTGWIAGWAFGTARVSRIWDDAGACDEPPAFTSGGNLVYWGEGVNHQAWGTVDVARPPGRNAWTWQDPRAVPGARTKYFFNPNAPDLWLASRFGDATNGVYSYYDGVTNQSPVPYRGRLYLVNANVLYAMSPEGRSRQLPAATAPATRAAAAISLTRDDVRRRLATEVEKIVEAGHLRPGYYNFGYVNRWLGTNHVYRPDAPRTEVIAGDRMTDYFHTPGDTLATLSAALPYLDAALQARVKTYLRAEQAAYPVERVAHIGWRDGARREAWPDPPELAAIMRDGSPEMPVTTPRETITYPTCCATWVNIGPFPPDAFDGAWRYAAAVLDPAGARALFDAMKPRLPRTAGTDLNDLSLVLWPYILNQYIAGYRGYLELERLAGYTRDVSESTEYAEYQRLLALRVDHFDANSPFASFRAEEYQHNFVLNVARNFMWLTPELGEALGARQREAVRAALAEYDAVAPFWFVPKYERTYEEGVGHHLFDRWALFLARAYVIGAPFGELVKYLDEPAFARGDLFYIQNLIATLAAPD